MTSYYATVKLEAWNARDMFALGFDNEMNKNADEVRFATVDEALEYGESVYPSMELEIRTAYRAPSHVYENGHLQMLEVE